METASSSGPDIKCSFCGKTRAEVKKIIAGPTVYICDECVGLCNDIIAEEAEAPPPEVEMPELAPLIAHFDATVVGQTAAKRALIAALRLHAERVIHESAARVPHVLLVGPRGSGKTTLGRAVCSALGLPSFHVDVGRLSESGYVGDDVEHLCVGLVWRASSPSEAERGVLFLDGIEKIRAQRPLSTARDISGEGVQRELVRLLDGLELSIPNMRARHPQALGEVFHTDRVLVVAACSLESLPKGATDRVLREKLREAGLVDAVLASPLRTLLTPIERTAGYYFDNLRLGHRDGFDVVFEASDYARMHARHASGALYKLVFHANGRLCGGWSPERDVLWEAASA